MNIKEIKPEELDYEKFIEEKVREISKTVGDGVAINALSGGVDSSVVTVLGHRALGDRLRTVFIDNDLMRKGEPEHIASIFGKMGIKVEIIDAKKEFYARIKGKSDPEEKREGITQAFYKDVFGKIVKKGKAKFLLHGTNLTDVEETVAGVKRQHNILDQLGIDTQKAFGYKVIEPIVQLRKTGVRKVGKALGLPEELYNRPPFPGPALAARVIGEVNPKNIAVIKEATVIVEEELKGSGAFQYLAILHGERVTGIRDGKRDYGYQIEVRCWESMDARLATPTQLPFDKLLRLGDRITGEVPGVVSVTYNIARKPPSTIEAV